ncbi:retrotran gag 3 domain-containing protein [Citrus sinensis]|uniref:Retrotran gag 3 domain-containing protein n=1 Tax=Citrus sinensis TaxID=2711 RepID=A0ACB8HRQ5_CITSI|nr:retrotran gag 3 domain-containing protein [Citrus sinensis]
MIANALDAGNKFTAAQVSRKLKQLDLRAGPLKKSKTDMHLRDEEPNDSAIDKLHDSDQETLLSFRKRSKHSSRLFHEESQVNNLKGRLSDGSDDETLMSRDECFVQQTRAALRQLCRMLLREACQALEILEKSTNYLEFTCAGNIPSLSTPTIVHTAITENTSLQITSHKLNGKNFLPWSRSVQMVIRGHGKLGYLLGQKQRPDENDPAFQTWDAENSIVMAWLVNSMEPNIGQTYLFYQTAAELWEAVKETYSDLENSSQLFELRNMARNLKQGDMDVTHYFNSLKNLWQELALFNECEWRCIDDGARYKKLVDKNRIYDFLAGLNKELDDVRGRILGTKPLPSIREIFAEVRREESRKRVMLGEPKSLTAPEMSALAV